MYFKKELENPFKLYPSWTTDIWALGMCLLEIAIGFPVWLENQCIVHHFNKKTPFMAQRGIMQGPSN